MPSPPPSPSISQAPSGAPVVSATAGARVLLVEPDPAFTDDVRRMCADRHWTLTCARTGPEALERWDPGMDLVLVELGLPGMGGFELIEQLRRQPEGTAALVLVLSAAPPGPTVLSDRLRSSGALEFHHKPLSLTVLASRLEALLQATGSMVLEPELTQAGRWLCPEVDRRLAAAARQLPNRGPYRGRELLDLLLGCLEHRRSGLLRLSSAHQREVHLREGWPVEADSDAPGEDLLTLAAEESVVRPEALPRLLARQRAYNLSMSNVLTQGGKVSVPKLRLLQEAQIARVIGGAVSEPGWFEFFPDPAGRDDMRTGLAPLPLLIGALDSIDVGELGSELIGLAGQRLLPGPAWRQVEGLPTVPGELQGLLDAIRATTTLEEVLAAEQGEADARIRLLWLLLRIRAVLARPV